MRFTCSAQLLVIDLITLIYAEDQKLLRTPCTLVAFTLLGPNSHIQLTILKHPQSVFYDKIFMLQTR